MKIINFEKKKMIPLTSKNYEPYLHQTNCHICKKNVNINALMTKIIVNLHTVIIILVNSEVLHIAYVI